MIIKEAEISTTQKGVVRQKYFKEGKVASNIARFLVKSNQNNIKTFYRATNVVYAIVIEEEKLRRLNWLKKAEDSLSEEELFKIPLNPLWKLPY